MIPPRYVLMNVPDAAALILVDHSARRITFLDVIEDYGGPGEARQWAAFRQAAMAAIASQAG